MFRDDTTDKEMGYYTLCKQLKNYDISKVYQHRNGSLLNIGFHLYKKGLRKNWVGNWTDYVDSVISYKITFEDGKVILKDGKIEYSNYIQECVNRKQPENIVPEPNQTTFEFKNIQELIDFINDRS